MILVTGKDTGLPAYIWIDEIYKIEEKQAGSCPFTRVYLKNDKQHHDYFLDILESKEELKQLIQKNNKKEDLLCKGHKNLESPTAISISGTRRKAPGKGTAEKS